MKSDLENTTNNTLAIKQCIKQYPEENALCLKDFDQIKDKVASSSMYVQCDIKTVNNFQSLKVVSFELFIQYVYAEMTLN